MRSEEFEKWFAETYKVDESEVAEMWDGFIYTSYHCSVKLAWAAWNAGQWSVVQYKARPGDPAA